MNNSIFLALDFPTWEETKHFLDQNDLHEVPVKVGMELFYREGNFVIEALKKRNHPIFLDLKLHDIPTTVMRAMRNLAALEVEYVNLHALGGSDMIQKAKEGLQSSSTSACKFTYSTSRAAKFLIVLITVVGISCNFKSRKIG